MLFTFAVLAVTILLFVFSKLRADLVALLSMLALYLGGVLTTQQALAGFADSTTVMIAALFVVGEGLSRTGVTAWLGQHLMAQAGGSPMRLLVIAMAGTALLSSVLSNTGTVAVLLPAVTAAAWRLHMAPSRFLLPIAIAANLGGLLTLIGTPPNIVVTDALATQGARPFSFFEFAWIGVPQVTAAILFMAFFGFRLLRDRPSEERPVDVVQLVSRLVEEYQLAEQLHRVRVRPGSPLVGKTLREAALGRDFGVSVVVVQPDHVPLADHREPGEASRLRAQLERIQRAPRETPGPETVLHENDILVLDGEPDAVQRAMEAFDLEKLPLDVEGEELANLLLSQDVGVAKVLVAPRCEDQNRTLARAQFAGRFGVQVLAMRRGDELLSRTHDTLHVGDSLLVRGRWSNINALARAGQGYVVVGEPESLARQVVALSPRSLTALAILAGMILLMATSAVSTVMAVLLAAMAMALAGCLPISAMYRSIQWQTVVLIAAMLPMSTALQVTGGAQLVADALVTTLGQQGPLALMAGVFLLTAGFSQVMSNTATTVLVAPIAYNAALSLGVAPQPLLMMVAVGASAALLTPIASPTNALVYIPGGYTWGDYARVGLPLLLIVMGIGLTVVPLVWPL
jgi:di/tricarboxylate transporter